MAVKKWVAVNAHVTNALTEGPCDGIYAGGAGNVVAKPDDHATDVTIPVVAGGYVIGRFSHVRATSTATGMFALYEG
jgi:hypothetical protein